jgi:hypothetical protein
LGRGIAGDGAGDGGGTDDVLGRVNAPGDMAPDIALGDSGVAGGSALEEFAPRRSPMIGGSTGETSRRSAAGDGDSALTSSGLGGGGSAGALSRLTTVASGGAGAVAAITGPDSGTDQLDDSDGGAGSGTPVAGECVPGRADDSGTCAGR